MTAADIAIVKGRATDRAASVMDVARGIFQLASNLVSLAE